MAIGLAVDVFEPLLLPTGKCLLESTANHSCHPLIQDPMDSIFGDL